RAHRSEALVVVELGLREAGCEPSRHRHEVADLQLLLRAAEHTTAVAQQDPRALGRPDPVVDSCGRADGAASLDASCDRWEPTSLSRSQHVLQRRTDPLVYGDRLLLEP